MYIPHGIRSFLMNYTLCFFLVITMTVQIIAASIMSIKAIVFVSSQRCESENLKPSELNALFPRFSVESKVNVKHPPTFFDIGFNFDQ